MFFEHDALFFLSALISALRQTRQSFLLHGPAQEFLESLELIFCPPLSTIITHHPRSFAIFLSVSRRILRVFRLVWRLRTWQLNSHRFCTTVTWLAISSFFWFHVGRNVVYCLVCRRVPVLLSFCQRWSCHC